ncbi:transglutaminase domain-containing protein [Emticicia oligotrophica DSM 17448]|uniref:Transglutaminase domain-containing protein n=1 Tax=Emticicia oligotrophica (strain DSM 17448 / CIP 109782 / MTCC 6937 / GPTSA100-15) TaxID=929562 RepID=A0ABM5N4N1_EMTOG|nr:transglutaminase family protein [Emticicia oligotrophica]AFK04465.1 transglutaminase domain-containing protein [Emticicia oligotrophica DSM 17448]
MKYKLRHKTVYTYVNPVDNYQSVLCLEPLNLPIQSCQNFELAIDPHPTKIHARTDYFGNTQHYFSLHESHQLLQVIASSDIEILPKNTPRISLITCEEAIERFKKENHLKTLVLQYQLPSPFIKWDEEVRAFAETCLQAKTPLFEAVSKLSAKIFHEFQFKSGFTSVNTPLKTVLKERKGVCQDFSHLAIACLRSVGLAARYVSGYIETLPPPGKPKLQGSDASHAWISVYIPDMGWCEFDPTNNLIPKDKHIITAYGRDYSDVAPLKGIIFSSGEHRVSVEVDVIRV